MNPFSLESKSDEELMILYQNGSESAFQMIYNRHSAKVFGFVKSRIHHTQYAEEVFQDTFVRMHKSKHLYNHSLPLLPWLFTITKNVIIDFQRKTKTSSQHSEYLDEMAYQKNLEESPVISPLNHLVKELPLNQMQAIELRYYEEKTFDEIAKKLNTSPLNVRQLISRGLKRIRELVHEEAHK